MKKNNLFGIVLVSAFGLLPSALGQGALTPPGPPVATMKTLAQIEPRTPISAAPLTIAAGGSYYLTTNLTVSAGNAIMIAANNVTLDLCGFSIASSAAVANGTAIFLGAVTNVAINNGHISSGVTNTIAGVFGGSGFANGISYSGYSPCNVRVKEVSVAGVLTYGINLSTDNTTVVAACTVMIAGNCGIYAESVSESTAQNCGQYGIYATTANNCTGSGVAGGYGLDATTANNCYGYSTGNGDGLDGKNASNCQGYSNGSGYGLNVNAADNCNGYSSGGCALAAVTADHCVAYNYTSGYGLYASTVATGCYGYSGTGTGLYTVKIASCCYGYSGTGTGLSAFIANSCSGTSLLVTHNLSSF